MKLRSTGLLLFMATALTITACGQKGPLYLPKRDATAVPATSTEDASDKSGAADDASNGSVDSADKGDSSDR